MYCLLSSEKADHTKKPIGVHMIQVWQHLTDVERWHEWNPFQQQATGDGLQVQSVMHFKLVQISKGWTSSSREQVSAVEAPTNDENGEGGGQRARWVYKYTGLLAAIGGVSSVRETVRHVCGKGSDDGGRQVDPIGGLNERGKCECIYIRSSICMYVYICMYRFFFNHRALLVTHLGKIYIHLHTQTYIYIYIYVRRF